MVLPVTAGLAVNLSSAGYSDYQQLPYWVDLSGNGYHFYPGTTTQPIVRPGVTPLGGRAVDLSGVWGYLNNTSAMFDGATGGEMFAVVQMGTTNSSGFYQLGGSGITQWPNSSNIIKDGSFTNTMFNFSNPVNHLDWHIYNVTHDGTTRTTYIDNVVVHTATVPFTNPVTSSNPTIFLGNCLGPGAVWYGYFGEFAIYKRSLSTAERTSVHNYLRQQYIDATVPVNPLAKADAPALKFSVSMPAATTPPPSKVSSPPLALQVGINARLSGVVDKVAAPALTYNVALGTATTPLAVPPLAYRMGISAKVTEKLLELTSPADEDTVQVTDPQFVVALNVPDPTREYTIEVQYAADDTFASPTTVTTDVIGLEGGAFITPPTAVPETTFWRARLTGGDESDWTPTQSFTVDTDLTPASTTVSWTVGNANRPIHLWHLDPPSAAPGDTVTAYGQGFPETGHVTFDGVPVTVTRWDLIEQPGGPVPSTRAIDGDNVFPEHYEIDFTVPDYTGPGAALAVTP